MTIFLKDIFSIENTGDYKIHFARYNQYNQPLDAWINGEWERWQEYWPGRDDFNKPFIFSLMSFYHEPNTWLYGGIFKVIERKKNEYYRVELTNIGKNFIGRLKINYPYPDRATRPHMMPHYNKFEVKEILPEAYSGRSFPGYEDINLSFVELEGIVKAGKLDWKTALENIKGIYLIFDRKSLKKYVGSAYGENGIWSRWNSYIHTGHGGNDGIADLISNLGIEYCRENFHFALLEQRPFNIADDKIISRESYWKEVLQTRGESGLNRN